MAAALLPLGAAAEVVCALGPAASSYNAYQDQKPRGDAMQLAREVNEALVSNCRPRCPQIAVFRNPTAPNAMLIAGDGPAKIVYAPEFFTTIYEQYGDGPIVAVIAHELGHALDETAPASWMKNTPSPELRADAWAGCALARVAVSANGLAGTLSVLAKYPSPSHPAWGQRLPALRLGFTQCGGDGPKFDRAAAGRKK